MLNKKKKLMLYVDGASRSNPGLAGAGIYLIKDDKILCQKGFFLGTKTNNEAEYYALILGLFFIHEHQEFNNQLIIYSDSQLLVRQLQGVYRVRDQKLIPLYQTVKQILLGVDFSLIHVPREENTIADKLANEGIDKKNELPIKFLTFVKQYAN